MIGKEQKGYIYYRCHTSDCSNKCIRETDLEDDILTTLNPLRLEPDEVSALDAHLADLKERWEDDRQNQIQGLELQLEKLDSRLDRLTDAFLDETLEEELFERKKGSLLDERAELEETLHNLREKKVSVPDRVGDILELAKKPCLSYKMAKPDEKRILLQKLTSNRTVDRQNASIDLKKPFCWIAERPTISQCRDSRERTRTLTALLDKLARYAQNNMTDPTI